MSFASLSHGGEAGCDPFSCPCKKTPLSMSIFTAAQVGDLVTVQQRVLRSPSCLLHCDTYGYSAVHYAAQNGHSQILRFLLSNGALPDGGTCGASPLHRAAYAGSVECCEILLKAGANVNAQDSSFGDMCTPAHKAVLGGHTTLLPLLMRFGASLDSVNAEGLSVRDLMERQAVPSAPAPSRPPIDRPALEAGAPPAALGCSRCGCMSYAFRRNRQGELICLQCKS